MDWKSREDLQQWAGVREISDEIALALAEIETESRSADDIWAAPTEDEELTVIARAWELADDEEDYLVWGGIRRRAQ